MKHYNPYFFSVCIFVAVFFLSCKVTEHNIKQVNVLNSGFYGTKPIKFTEEILREKCIPVEIMDLDFCISFKRELDASERTLSLKNDFSWYAICDIYYDNGDSATLFFAKSFMVLNHKVYKRKRKAREAHRESFT
jgi:hypothetical protein